MTHRCNVSRHSVPTLPLPEDLVGQSIWLLTITTRYGVVTVTAHTHEEAAYTYLRNYACDLLAMEGFDATDETVTNYFRQEGGTWSIDGATIAS